MSFKKKVSLLKGTQPWDTTDQNTWCYESLNKKFHSTILEIKTHSLFFFFIYLKKGVKYIVLKKKKKKKRQRQTCSFQHECLQNQYDSAT